MSVVVVKPREHGVQLIHSWLGVYGQRPTRRPIYVAPRRRSCVIISNYIVLSKECFQIKYFINPRAEFEGGGKCNQLFLANCLAIAGGSARFAEQTSPKRSIGKGSADGVLYTSWTSGHVLSFHFIVEIPSGRNRKSEAAKLPTNQDVCITPHSSAHQSPPLHASQRVINGRHDIVDI